MSIGQRFVNLFKSNITSILDRAREDGSLRIENLSDSELEAELKRRKQRREAAERVAGVSADEEAWAEAERAAEAGTGRFRTAGRGGRSSYRHSGTYRKPGSGGRDPRLAKLYAQLECPYGADATIVRKHYRKMMRKYHPDMHSGDSGKERIATELSQRLTQAYNELKRALATP